MPKRVIRNKSKRVKEAKERAEKAAERTPQEQLQRLDRMFGKGLGAVKERAKLAEHIANKAENNENS